MIGATIMVTIFFIIGFVSFLCCWDKDEACAGAYMMLVSFVIAIIMGLMKLGSLVL